MFGGIDVAEYTSCPEHFIFGLDIGTRSIVGTVGYREDERHFHVVAQVVRMHETRSMLDGQIHDIQKVSETIRAVKDELEKQLQYKLEKVCIAAAGRVLKTVTVHTELGFEEEQIVDGECIHTLELLGMEAAYEKMKDGMEQDISMYCVGSTVIHYYLDDYIMLSLEGHRGKKISADFLATFLPDEVIDSLYAAVEKAGLSVANLTLEPIAASEVAIPVNFRLLNIALVDVGAGTSDISITKDGSIIGYGMIPTAGDAFTEEIAKKYLVDFAGAENIKIACFANKAVKYKDIMGVQHKVEASEVLEGLKDTISATTKKVAEKIKELNGGSSVSAVFIVGGGGKLPNFAATLAEHLELPYERVAVRGKEVFNDITFEQEDVTLDSTLVTPIGICLTYLLKNNAFIMVSVNGRQVKLYDNNKLAVMDATVQIGFPKDSLFPKRGRELTYYVNNEKRMVRGEAGEGAVITVNGKSASFNTKIVADDIIEILPSTAGADAKSMVGDVPEYKRKGELHLTVNGKSIICPRMVRLNGEVALETKEIKEEDRLEILDYYVIEDLMEYMDMPMPEQFFLNGRESNPEDHIYDGTSVECVWENDINETGITIQEETTMEQSGLEGEIRPEQKEEILHMGKIVQEDERTEKEPATSGIYDITVTVNDTDILLSGKSSYIFVDILDVYPFDTSVAGGTSIVTTINGTDATFSTPIQEGDQIALYWKD